MKWKFIFYFLLFNFTFFLPFQSTSKNSIQFGISFVAGEIEDREIRDEIEDDVPLEVVNSNSSSTTEMNLLLSSSSSTPDENEDSPESISAETNAPGILEVIDLVNSTISTPLNSTTSTMTTTSSDLTLTSTSTSTSTTTTTPTTTTTSTTPQTEIFLKNETSTTTEAPILIEKTTTSTSTSTSTSSTTTTSSTPIPISDPELIQTQNLSLIEEQKIQEQKIEEQKIQEQKIEEQKIQEQKIEEQKLQEQKLREQKLQEQKIQQQNITDTIKKLLENYDKKIRPNIFGPPTQVEVTIIVNSVSSVNEVNMEFDVDFYLRQSWTDPRLAFHLDSDQSDFWGNKSDSTNTTQSTNQNSVKVIGLSGDFMDQIWRPDSYFLNERKSYIHKATVPNRLVRLFPNGSLITSTRLTLTAACVMYLELYPMDHQICGIKMGSYGFSDDQIVYRWAPYKYTHLNSSALPQFIIEGQKRYQRTFKTLSESYSVLILEFLFVRSLTYYLTTLYVPCFLVVNIAYFAVYMGRETPAPRLGLGVTTVLTMTTLFISNNARSPPINYVKALDIYMAFCFIAVFSTLLESVTIVYLGKKAKNLKEKKKLAEAAKKVTSTGDVEVVPGGSPDSPKDEGKNKDVEKHSRFKDKELNFFVSKIEVIVRIFFPFMFISFNIIYWSYFLNASKLKFPENYWSKDI